MENYIQQLEQLKKLNLGTKSNQEEKTLTQKDYFKSYKLGIVSFAIK